MGVGQSIEIAVQVYLLAFVVATGVAIMIKVMMAAIHAISPKEEKKVTE